MSKPRIGAVSYLNTKPLVEGLGGTNAPYDLVFDLPSRLADRLKRGELDVALIPAIEAADAQYSIISDACIACCGEVWSVKMMYRDAELRIDSLALDEGSRTSCALVKILLAQQYDLHPEYLPLPIRDDWTTSEADAVLIIGDRAMKASDENFPFEMDLGTAWHQWTKLPFVFAVWAARESSRCSRSDLIEIGQWLGEARDRGIANSDALADQHAGKYGLTVEECQAYFQKHLHFTLGRREKMGLEMYYRYASRMMLIPRVHPLEYLTTNSIS